MDQIVVSLWQGQRVERNKHRLRFDPAAFSNFLHIVFDSLVVVVSGFGRVKSDCESVVVVSAAWSVVLVFVIDFVNVVGQ